tara:strand:- start:2154 stop:3638 length:1485 start_codon:yes stop_codon:yes gene_type:complete
MTGKNHIPLDQGSFVDGVSYQPTSDKEFNIVYTFPKTTIVSSELEKKNDRIQISYNTSHTYPNLTIQDYINYSAYKITISKLVHNIFPGITEPTTHRPEYQDSNGDNKIIGEMFIEHKPTANTGNNLALCFLLMKSNSSLHSNDIDKLIQMTGTNDSFEDLWISNSIPKQINSPASAVTYNSKNYKVIVFLTPILINNDSVDIINDFDPYDISHKFLATFDNLKDDDSIAGSKRTYLLHESRHVNKSTAEDKIYIKCHPTGASQEEINTYNVPVESEYTKQAQELELTNSSLNLIFFSGFLVLIYFVVPLAYFRIIYKGVLSLGNFPNTDSKAGMVRNIDNSVFIILCLLIVYLIYSDIPNSMSYVIYAIFAIGVSILLIVNKKGSDPDWIQIIDYDDNNIKTKFSGFLPQNLKDFLILLISIIIYPIYDLYNDKIIYGLWAFIAFFLAIYYAIEFGFKDRKKWNEMDTFYTIFIAYGTSLFLYASGVTTQLSY